MTIVYGWPGDDEKADAPRQNIFTREWGENVDDWYAHNNDNRASRSWGERPMKVQALSLAKTYDGLYRTTGKFIGGAQWHPLTISAAIIPIRIGAVYTMRSASPSMPIICSEARLPTIWIILWLNPDLWYT